MGRTMGYIIKPPTTKKFESDLEHIPQSHFVKKTEKEAITKHIVKDEPEQFATGSVDVSERYKMIEYKSTSSYDPYTFTMETSYKGVLEAIENGKDTDLVAMPVGEVRKMQERIRVLEREVMKSKTGRESLDHQRLLDIERERIKADQQRIQWSAKHKHETELRKEEIKRQLINSKNWEKMFNS